MNRSLFLVGPSGSGKTSLSKTLHKTLLELNRPSILVNLDPYNLNISKDFMIDIQDLIQLEDVMEDCSLGYRTNNINKN